MRISTQNGQSLSRLNARTMAQQEYRSTVCRRDRRFIGKIAKKYQRSVNTRYLSKAAAGDRLRDWFRGPYDECGLTRDVWGEGGPLEGLISYPVLLEAR